MTVTHTNRKGQTYHLHQGTNKAGKLHYYFSLSGEGNLVDAIPPGYEIYEHPNSQVFLRKIRTQIIKDEEVAIVEDGLRRHSRMERFIVDVKKDAILIYTPNQDPDLLAETFELFGGVHKSRTKARIEHFLNYSSELKFVLVDKGKRLFQTHRYCYLGSMDDWISIGPSTDLPKLVSTYVRHLGEESFFDLY